MNDELAKLARETEQQEAGFEALSNMTAIYFHTLVKNRLTRAEALHLTAVMLASMMGSQKATGG